MHLDEIAPPAASFNPVPALLSKTHSVDTQQIPLFNLGGRGRGLSCISPLDLTKLPIGTAARAKRGVFLCLTVPEWNGFSGYELRVVAESRFGSAVEIVYLPDDSRCVVVCGGGVPSIQNVDEAYERVETLPQVIKELCDREAAVMVETRALQSRLARIRAQVLQRRKAVAVLRAQLAHRLELMEVFRLSALRVKREAEAFIGLAAVSRFDRDEC